MFDIWGFLLQTLTVSGVGALILIIKALLRDKLPPKWHFATCGVLLLTMVLPAGIKGRYTLFQWQVLVEMIKGLIGDFSSTKVLFPIPVITHMPKTATQWIFVIYAVGVALFMIKYLISYIRLRIILLKGKPAQQETVDKVKIIAESLKIKSCKIITVKDLPSAFVCGVFRPVLVLPEEKETDSKIILHELIHVKLHDPLFSTVVCLMKSLHWCNPFIAYCASCAAMDMENRCDQYVLERLEGEQRREYGHILLSMVNERFTGTPATTCINNGGKSIRQRIETIARFKKYPAGMKLVSGCVLLILAFSIALGSSASAANILNISQPDFLYAKAKSTPCTTLAGAFDAYANGMLTQNDSYRIMCAPTYMHKEIYENMKNDSGDSFYIIESKAKLYTNSDSPYYIYNLLEKDTDTYEALLVFSPVSSPDADLSDGKIISAIQNVKAEKEDGRWVIVPLEKINYIKSAVAISDWGTDFLPYIEYSGENDSFKGSILCQTVLTVESYYEESSDLLYNTSTKNYTRQANVNAQFSQGKYFQSFSVTYLGESKEISHSKYIGVSTDVVYPGEDDPETASLPGMHHINYTNSSSDGQMQASFPFDENGKRTVNFGGGGYTFTYPNNTFTADHFVADVFINGEFNSRIKLYLKECD